MKFGAKPSFLRKQESRRTNDFSYLDPRFREDDENKLYKSYYSDSLLRRNGGEGQDMTGVMVVNKANLQLIGEVVRS